MARNQQKQSNRFDDYDDDYEYEVADDDCADDADDWSEDEEDGNFDESETTLKYQYHRKSRGGRPSPSLARSVGGRESRERRKKTLPSSWVRPTARKPTPLSRSNRNRHDNRRNPREPCRERSLEREQSNHGPHFWDRWRFRKNDRSDDDRGQERHRGTGNSPRRPDKDKACPNDPAATNEAGWRRFLVLMVLLACGTAFTFYATMDVPHEGNDLYHSQGENDPSSASSSGTSSNDGEKRQTTERRTPERSAQHSETRPAGNSSSETTPQDTQNQDTQNQDSQNQDSQNSHEHSDDTPGLRTQEWRNFPEQESDSHVASGLTRGFHQMNHTAETQSGEELLSDDSPGERPL